MADPNVPPPTYTYGPRPFSHTEDDHRGTVLVLSILFIVYALMIVGMRLFTKYRHMGIEDWLSIITTAILIPQCVSVIVATASGGLGESYKLLSTDDTKTIGKSLRASDVFFLLGLFVGKCTSIWLCRRLFAVGQHRKHLYCEIAIGICAIWCLGSIIAVNAGCTSTETIRADAQKCSGLVTRWTVVGTLDALLEFLILGLSIIVIFPLHMSMQRKVQALMCFVLRLPIIVLIALQIKYISDFNSSSNPGIALPTPILFRESEVLYSLLSAAIPALNQYLRKFDTTQATVFGYNAGQYGSGGRSYQMDSLGAPRSKTNGTKNGTRNGTINGTMNGTLNDDVHDDMGKSTGIGFGPTNHTQYHASVEGPHNEGGYNGDGRSNASHEEGSLGRHNSEEFIIRKDVEYTVRHEDR